MKKEKHTTAGEYDAYMRGRKDALTEIYNAIQRILDPVCDSKYHSNNTLEDVITNMVLMQINMLKVSLDDIPQKEVRNYSNEKIEQELLEHILLYEDKKRTFLSALLKDMRPLSYRDKDQESFSSEELTEIAFVIALKNLLNLPNL